MPTPSSGPISLLDVQNEFGGSNPIGIDEYYGRAAGIPSSGTISLSNFYGKSSSPFTSYVFGYRNSMSFYTTTDTYTGNVITPGSSQSPKTFRIYLVSPGFFVGAGAGGSTILRYYQNGSLNTTFTANSSNNNYYDVNYTFSFGSSSMQFESTIYDPYTYDDVYGSALIQWSTSQGAPDNRTLYNHIWNLSGGGNLN